MISVQSNGLEKAHNIEIVDVLHKPVSTLMDQLDIDGRTQHWTYGAEISHVFLDSLRTQR